MLKVKIPKIEGAWNGETFVDVPETELILEHNLVSLSKWESKWKKPFFDGKEKSIEETLDYVRCMCQVEPDGVTIIGALPMDELRRINLYIDDPMTASVFKNDRHKGKIQQKRITSELLYYYMTALNINWEAEYWHLNRLIALIKTCNLENAPKKKMSQNEILRQNRELNEKRKAMLHTKG